jgi:SAM-dependent methyltransferase
MQWTDYLTLFNLARKRLDSPEAYVAFQRFQGDLLGRFLVDRGLNPRGRRVLDLGSGYGGYSLALRDSGASVISADLSPVAFEGSQTVRADARLTPFASNSFDMVVCASLIEHVPAPDEPIREIHRLLRVGGTLYLSFPPFYTPIGGHQFSPFHLFGERAALQIIRMRRLYRGKQWLQAHYSAVPKSYATAWGDWGLYPLTIARVEKTLRMFRFEMIERSTRWLPFDFSGVPVLGEFLTWHVQFLLRKLG